MVKRVHLQNVSRFGKYKKVEKKNNQVTVK